MVDWTCQCAGTGWVCEVHHLVPWRNGDGCCGAAGMPCSQCNTTLPPRYAPDTHPVGFDDEPRAAAPMSLLELPSLSKDWASGISHYTFVPHDPSRPSVELDDVIDSMKFAGAPEHTVLDFEEPMDIAKYQGNWQHADVDPGSAFGKPMLHPQDFADLTAQRAADKSAYDAISRRLFRASARQAWGQSVTDEELQDEALDDLYHELGIKREDR